jgi:hypothetical protein
MGQSLSGKTLGPPDNAFQWYLHSGGSSLAAGYTATLGNGDDTPLWLDSAGIGTKNVGGFVTKIRSAATADRIATFTDAEGEVFVDLVSRLAADATNSTVTPAAVADFGVNLAASSIYEFEIDLILESVITTTSPRWTLTGPTSETTYVYYENTGAAATATQFTAWGTAGANAVNAPANNTPYLVKIRGVVKTTSTTPATPVGISIFSEVASSQITLKAGSIMMFRKIG